MNEQAELQSQTEQFGKARWTVSTCFAAKQTVACSQWYGSRFRIEVQFQFHFKVITEKVK